LGKPGHGQNFGRASLAFSDTKNSPIAEHPCLALVKADAFEHIEFFAKWLTGQTPMG
jgi:hypothetical protein